MNDWKESLKKWLNIHQPEAEHPLEREGEGDGEGNVEYDICRPDGQPQDAIVGRKVRDTQVD